MSGHARHLEGLGQLVALVAGIRQGRHHHVADVPHVLRTQPELLHQVQHQLRGLGLVGAHSDDGLGDRQQHLAHIGDLIALRSQPPQHGRDLGPAFAEPDKLGAKRDLFEFSHLARGRSRLDRHVGHNAFKARGFAPGHHHSAGDHPAHRGHSGPDAAQVSGGQLGLVACAPYHRAGLVAGLQHYRYQVAFTLGHNGDSSVH